MAHIKERNFGRVLSERRRKLDLTQQGVARRNKTSTAYVGQLESAKRRPSYKIVTRLAEVLGLDRRELFFCPFGARLHLYPDNCTSCSRTMSFASRTLHLPREFFGRKTGRVVLSTIHEIAIEREDPELGKIVNHFPKIGFRIAAA
jgi:transcriptional regulator with XRE-family HTH domain